MNKFWKVVGCLIVGSILGNIYSYVKDTNERVKKVEKAVCPPAVKEEEEKPEEEPKEKEETKNDEKCMKDLDEFIDWASKQVFPKKEEKKENPLTVTLTQDDLKRYYEQWYDHLYPGLGKDVMSRYDISISEKPLHKEDK